MTDFSRAAKLRQLRAKTNRELVVLAERLTERAVASGAEGDLSAARSLVALVDAGREHAPRLAALRASLDRATPARPRFLAACC
jgi:hypothetical protein